MIVDFRVSEVALLLAARNQQFQLRLTLVRDLSRCACWRFFDQGGRLVEIWRFKCKPTSIRFRPVGSHLMREPMGPPGSGPWTAEAHLIRPFPRNSSPIPPLFAIIRPFGAPVRIPPRALP